MFTSIILAQVLPPVIGALLGAGIVYLAATSERFAAPARAKDAKDRGILDRAAIKADELIDAQIAALDRQQLQEFLTNFLLQHLPGIKATPTASAAVIADKLLPTAKSDLQRRNPDLSARQQLTTQSLKDLLTARLQAVIEKGVV